LPIDSESFCFHPNAENDPTDVAICPLGPRYQDTETGEIYHLAIRALLLDEGVQGSALPSDYFKKAMIGLGSEIAIIGLFRSHYGKNHNVPIVRVGNIAAMPGEPIHTEYSGYIDAYLVEARSIAGLSGSPVLAIPDSALALAEMMGKRRTDIQGTALLGLMHGHFDVRNLNEDVVSDSDIPERGIHTGIGVVVPAEKFVETLRHPDLTAMRKNIVEKMREEKGATADIADDATADAAKPSDANPNHLEDFTRLVDVAARKRPQGDQT
jgi:hypothetical protein